MPLINARAAIRRAVRSYFEDQGFLEVETPLRVPAPGQEIHLDPVASEDRWLITSPEYHMKRLVAAGYSPIFQLCRSWRGGEVGPHHEPEFSMLEWYRAGASLEDLITDCTALLRDSARAAGTYPKIPVPPERRRTGDPAFLCLDADFDVVSVAELFRRHLGIELRGDESIAQLRALLRPLDLPDVDADGWDDLFFRAWLDHIEPHVGRSVPTFVTDWPAPLAALARRRPENPAVALRFELYAGGLELANAFDELTDTLEQRRRFEEETARRSVLGKKTFAPDENLLAAVGHLPRTAGIAVGFDRLVMVVTGAAQITDVLPFSFADQ